MVKHDVFMTEAHYEIAVESILNGDNIAIFTWKENPHVVASEGTGMIYTFGKMYHIGLSKFKGDELVIEDDSEEKE